MSPTPAPAAADADRIVALIDASDYAGSVCDHAAWAAARTGFGLDLLHALGHRPGTPAGVNLSGNLTLGARSSLLADLAASDEAAARAARERGRALVEAARAHVAEVRPELADVRARLRTGGLLESVREAEPGARLIVVGKRGEHADFARGHLGSNLERVARAAHRPVLVASRAFAEPRRAVIAYDGGRSAEKAVDHAAAGRLFDGLGVTLLRAGGADAAMRARLEAAAARLRAAGRDAATLVEDGEPETVIARFVEGGGADLLVMGAYGHSPLRTLVIGSTTTAMIRACRIPVMLFRPDTRAA